MKRKQREERHRYVTYHSTYSSPQGTLTLECDGEYLCGLRFSSDADASDGKACRIDCPPAVFEAVHRWLDTYFAGHEPDTLPPLRLAGTDFQQRVWQELLTIPFGQTVSYDELARRIGCRSARAVGGAVHRNPIAIIVPCHRVVGTDGSLTGYAYGIERKRQLLEMENDAAFHPLNGG